MGSGFQEGNSVCNTKEKFVVLSQNKYRVSKFFFFSTSNSGTKDCFLEDALQLTQEYISDTHFTAYSMQLQYTVFFYIKSVNMAASVSFLFLMLFCFCFSHSCNMKGIFLNVIRDKGNISLLRLFAHKMILKLHIQGTFMQFV